MVALKYFSVEILIFFGHSLRAARGRPQPPAEWLAAGAAPRLGLTGGEDGRRAPRPGIMIRGARGRSELKGSLW